MMEETDLQKIEAPSKKALAKARASILCGKPDALLLRAFGFRGVGLRGIALGVLAAEALHATGGIQQFLLAGEERVAGGADFHVQIALVGGAGREIVSARAKYADFSVCGMNGCLHVGFNLDSNRLILQEPLGIQQPSK